MQSMTLGRQWELLEQFRELLLPSPSSTSNQSTSSWSSTTELLRSVDDECSIKVESGGALPDTANRRALSMADSEACGETQRRRGSKKRAQMDMTNKDDEIVEPAPGSNPQARCSKRRKRQGRSRCIVTSVPDFDGYQWRKYGQKQIEGTMYPRSYYRCTLSSEQGCPAKRTVQRNDNDGNKDTMAKYTVVYMAEHTCRANDSMEAPVILETTAAVVPTTTSEKKPPYSDAEDTNNFAAGPAAPFPPETTGRARRHDAAAAASDSSTTESAESPATSDLTWSNEEHVVDNRWAHQTTSSLLVQDMDDFTGPIRSPVHVAAEGCWTMDQDLLHLVNDPILSHCFSF